MSADPDQRLNRRGRRIVAAIKRRPKPRFIVSASWKGGVGKTLISVIVAELEELHGCNITVVQLDQQERLARSLGRDIIVLPSDFLKASRNDPGAGIRCFRALMEVIERAATTDEIILFDVGATLVEHFLAFASLAGLDDDLVASGIASIVLVPTVAEPEAIRLAARTISEFQNILPATVPILVHNERDGVFDDLIQGSRAHELYHGELLPLVADLPQVVMPAVTGRVWGLFERHHAKPISVVGMDIPTIMALTGLPRVEAKIVRGDIAAWVATMDEGLRPILGIGGEA